LRKGSVLVPSWPRFSRLWLIIWTTRRTAKDDIDKEEAAASECVCHDV
jgi:hypothetical protein